MAVPAAPGEFFFWNQFGLRISATHNVRMRAPETTPWLEKIQCSVYWCNRLETKCKEKIQCNSKARLGPNHLEVAVLSVIVLLVYIESLYRRDRRCKQDL